MGRPQKQVCPQAFEGDAVHFFEKLSAWADERLQACEEATSTVLWLWHIRKWFEKKCREKNLKPKDAVDANVHYKVFGAYEHIYVPCIQV